MPAKGKRLTRRLYLAMRPPAFFVNLFNKFQTNNKGGDMSLIKRSNFPTLGGSILTDFFDDDRFLNSPWLGGRNMPAVNIKETDKDYEVELAAPGYDKKDFNISIDNGLLTISAERKEEKEKKEDNYTRREFGCSSFSRSFSLPTNTNEEDINARYEEGVLKLAIAKKTESDGKAKKAISIS
jgi:HSP20 family protein